MFFVIIDQNGQYSARELPHNFGDQPSRPWMWESHNDSNQGNNIFWEAWNSQPKISEPSLDDGCIVINHIKKWLGSIQTYSSVLRFIPPGYFLNVEDLNSKGMQEIKLLWEAQRFTQYINRTEDDVINMRFDCEIKKYSSEEQKDFGLFCQALIRQQVYPTQASEMLMDPPLGWTFEEWESDEPEGYQRLLEEVARYSEIPYSWVEAWEEYTPNAKDLFNSIQSDKQKRRVLSHISLPVGDTKKKI